MKVLVAGAGIMGSSLCLDLAKRGCKVHIIDPNPRNGATPMSWAWLNANKKNPQHYKELNMKGMAEWKKQYPSLVHECGSVLLDDVSPSIDPNYPTQHLNADELLQLEPHLSLSALLNRPIHRYAQESWVDPEKACRYMLEEAKKLGAQVHLNEQVQSLLTRSNDTGEMAVEGIVTSSGQTLLADVVVLACGPAVQELAAQAQSYIPMLHKPARIALTAALEPGLLKSMLCAKDIYLMQRPDGTFLLGEPYDSQEEDTSYGFGKELLSRAAEILPALKQTRISSVHVAYRPFPKDGHPVVGFAAERLYVCTAHSGMTLASYVTKLASQEWDPHERKGSWWSRHRKTNYESMTWAQVVSCGKDLAEDLAPYRPQRAFSENNQVYGWNLYHKAKQ